MAKRGLGTAQASALRATLSVSDAAAVKHLPVQHRVISIRVPEELHERFLNAIDFLSGPPERLSYVLLARRAIEREIERLEKKHHSGRPFPSRPKS